jgi:glycerate-2-kinase
MLPQVSISPACDPRGHVAALVHAALVAADPGDALARAWPEDIGEGPWDALAVGKAAGPMIARADTLCRIERACCIGSPGTLGDLRGLHAIVDAREADHPLPTRRNTEASLAAAAFVRAARERHRRSSIRGLLVLLSGGASALLSLPAYPLTLNDIRAVTSALLRGGAPIGDLNCVRKHLESLKGGGIARLAHPTPVWTLILSDVLGDDLATIGSGPTCADPTTFADALRVLDTYGARDASPAAARFLQDGATGLHPETLKPRDPLLAHLHHRIIANNRVALDAVARHARELGYSVVQTTPEVQGEARVMGRRLANQALHLQTSTPYPRAVVIGGETTVTVTGRGVGGRNQEFALGAALELANHPGVVVASYSTDGIDGPTNAAGAVATSTSVADALASPAAVRADAALHDNDSHRFFEACDGLIRTGPTGTNVNDIAVALIHPSA